MANRRDDHDHDQAHDDRDHRRAEGPRVVSPDATYPAEWPHDPPTEERSQVDGAPRDESGTSALSGKKDASPEEEDATVRELESHGDDRR